MRALRLSSAGTVILALLGGLAGAVLAQDEADVLQLVTEEVEPGVERIISDGFGHDLDETHPTYRYDMDAIAIAPDGTVWLSTTHHGSDNATDEGLHVWVLGQPDTYIRDLGLPSGGEIPAFVALADGTMLAFAPDLDTLFRFDGERFVPDAGPMLRPTADGGLLLLLAGADLAAQLSESQVEDFPELRAVWDGGQWAWLDERGRTDVRAGDQYCVLEDDPGPGADGGGVTCGWTSGGWVVWQPTTYLAGTYINQLAAAPDGSVWAVGGYDGGPGGLYRITLPESDAD